MFTNYMCAGDLLVDRPTQLFYIWIFICCVNIQILKTQQSNLLIMIINTLHEASNQVKGKFFSSIILTLQGNVCRLWVQRRFYGKFQVDRLLHRGQLDQPGDEEAATD